MFKIEITKTVETDRFLEKYPAEFRLSLIKGFTRGVKYLEGKVKESFGKEGKPKVKSGALRRSITSTITERSKFLVGSVGSNLIYAPVHEFGATIHAKKSPFLKFKIGARWFSMKKVTIPARPYLYPTIVENSRQFNEIVSGQLVGDFHDKQI
jgi:phage gpG-like protein